jgi:hypothetical protein
MGGVLALAMSVIILFLLPFIGRGIIKGVVFYPPTKIVF